MYYPSSENKGADQLRGYREADLRLCFRLGKNLVFSRCGSFVKAQIQNPGYFPYPLYTAGTETQNPAFPSEKLGEWVQMTFAFITGHGCV